MINTLHFDFMPSYYFRHPIKFFKECIANLKNAWMRITKGYCYTDVWDMDTWFCNVFPPMLRHMADKGMAYPGNPPFETPEKWHDWLHSVADVIETFNDEDFWYTTKNEYSKDWERVSRKKEDKDYEEIKELYFLRMDEIAKERQALIENTFQELGRAFDCLWD